MISLSASTAHTLLMGWEWEAFADKSPTTSSGTSRYFAARAMNVPDPAAHLSLLLNSRTLPLSVTEIARVHWLPMSRTAPAWGRRKETPRAALVISVVAMSGKLRL